MIKPFSCDISDGKGKDIFKHLREEYLTENLHESGYVTLYNSSLSAQETPGQFDITAIIGEDEKKRWVSGIEQNPYFKIDFHSNNVFLLGYSIETNKSFRFIQSWKLYGIKGNQYFLIDSQQNYSLCEKDPSNACKETKIVPFRCQRPGSFHKFKFMLTSPDSLGENILSLSKIKFFGALNPLILCKTLSYQKNYKFSLSLLFILISL